LVFTPIRGKYLIEEYKEMSSYIHDFINENFVGRAQQTRPNSKQKSEEFECTCPFDSPPRCRLVETTAAFALGIEERVLSHHARSFCSFAVEVWHRSLAMMFAVRGKLY
jgi:hypothetical protein